MYNCLVETAAPKKVGYICSTPAPGHFNDDDTVDFMIHLNYGKWPEYFYSLVRSKFRVFETILSLKCSQ